MNLPYDCPPNEQVLLQVGYFIMSRPELLPGFVLKVEVNFYCSAYSSP
jgi:hypothetical protein